MVTVPENETEQLRKVIGDADAIYKKKFDKIDRYTHCSFSTKGMGRLLPKEGANPTIGKIGKLEKVAEERIEITCEKDNLENITQVIRNNHSYEEPVIDIYSLLNM